MDRVEDRTGSKAKREADSKKKQRQDLDLMVPNPEASSAPHAARVQPRAPLRKHTTTCVNAPLPEAAWVELAAAFPEHPRHGDSQHHASAVTPRINRLAKAKQKHIAPLTDEPRERLGVWAASRGTTGYQEILSTELQPPLYYYYAQPCACDR